MNTNRRQLRAVPNTLAFIQLDHDDGGRVLNLSEGGLSFEAFAPVLQRRGPIHFWFSLDLSERIEAIGKLAWTDATKKVGGLKFLELSPDARNRIRSWIGQSFKRKAVAPEHSEAETTIATSSLATELVPLERYRSATHRQFIRGIVLGVLVTSAVAVPALKYSHGGKELATSPPAASGQATLANSEPQGGASVPLSASDARRGSVASDAGKTRRSKQAGDSVDNPLGSTVVTPRLQSLDNPSGGSSHALSVALSHSPREISGAKKSVAPLQQLWSAVAGGNVQAALTLADLYLRGDGVPANCAQARMLLLVASKKGSAQAIKKLRELDTTGCPAPPP